MGDEIDIHLGQRLRHRRKLLSLTQQNVGNAIGVSLQQIQKYESGKGRMFATRLYQLADLLDVPVGYFYEGLCGNKPEPGSEETQRLASKETQDLLYAYYKLGEQPRRRLLDLAIAMNGKIEA